jgi:hypothetical protein
LGVRADELDPAQIDPHSIFNVIRIAKVARAEFLQ